jgi:hypothetical protein
MKRRRLVRDIGRAARSNGTALELVREGSAHSIVRCGGAQSAIPRHQVIRPGTAYRIRKQLEPTLGMRWWR